MNKTLKKLSVFMMSIALCCGVAALSACGDDSIDSSKYTVSLAVAYQDGYLFREDLMNISYYYCGSVTAVSDENCTGTASYEHTYDENGNIVSTTVTVNGVAITPEEISFTPTVGTPELTDSVATTLKSAYYTTHEEDIKRAGGGYGLDNMLIGTYYGEYSGHHVADMKLDFADVGTEITIQYIGGVEFKNKGNGYSIVVTIESNNCVG